MSTNHQNVPSESKNHVYLVALIIGLGGVAPLCLYWLFFSRVENIVPERAKMLLHQDADTTILIDIRPPNEYQEKHIDGARNWPLPEILAIRSLQQMPHQYRSKTLLLICQSGLSSVQAVDHLNRLGLKNVLNIRGGFYDWIGSASGPAGGLYERWLMSSAQVLEFPRREMSPLEQLTAVVSGFGFKGCYTIISLILIIILWRAGNRDLAALRWGLIFFFVGENFCLANYVLFFEHSYLFEYFHNFGMFLSFGFLTYALLEGLDARLLFLSAPDRKCAALSLCRECIKYKNVPCALKRMFFVIIPAGVVLCFILLSAPLHFVSYNSDIFGTYYHYCHQPIWQLFELRYCPIAAMTMFSLSLLSMLAPGKTSLATAKIFFAAGTAALGFGFFRMLLTGVFQANMLWFVFWEEATELLTILAVCGVLWIFRKALNDSTRLVV